MSRSSMLLLGSTLGILFLIGCIGFAIVGAALVSDLLTPDLAQTQAATADARLGAASRCNGLIVIGCNVDAAQEQRQAQAQQQEPAKPVSSWVWIAVIVLVLLVLFIGAILHG